VVLAAVLAIFAAARVRGLSEAEARAQSYTTLIIANLGLILTNRSRTRTILATLKTPNIALWLVLAGATIFLGLVLAVPFLQQVFRFAPLSPLDVVTCVAAGAFSILGFELVKFRPRRRPSSAT
jgi:P-type Ca2+ transporter type 2C